MPIGKERIMKLIAGLLVVLILAILVGVVAGIASAASTRDGGTGGAAIFFGAWVAGLIIALTAPRAGKAWRRLMIISGLMAFTLPLSGTISQEVTLRLSQPRCRSYDRRSSRRYNRWDTVSGALGFVGFF